MGAPHFSLPAQGCPTRSYGEMGLALLSCGGGQGKGPQATRRTDLCGLRQA